MSELLSFWPVALAAILFLVVRESLSVRGDRSFRMGRIDYSQFRLVRHVTNASEGRLHRALLSTLPAGLYVLVKPRLEDIVEVRRTARYRRQSLRGRVKSRHLDFVIVDRSMRPMAAIELDGPTHGRRDVRRVDQFKSRLAASVGLPLFRVPADMCYHTAAADIASQLRHRLKQAHEKSRSG